MNGNLIHLGYLTYNRSKESAYIPNREIEQEFIRAVKNGEGWGGLMDSLNRSAKLLEDTWRLDRDAVDRKIHG